jgi:formate hydrogenlyase subunit 3/multisubunit Na+/H+ antiporter MnhD subunit
MDEYVNFIIGAIIFVTVAIIFAYIENLFTYVFNDGQDENIREPSFFIMFSVVLIAVASILLIHHLIVKPKKVINQEQKERQQFLNIHARQLDIPRVDIQRTLNIAGDVSFGI